MERITDLKVLEEYSKYGIYSCNFKGNYKIFTKNGEVFKVITHYFDKDELDLITDSVKDELKELLSKI